MSPTFRREFLRSSLHGPADTALDPDPATGPDTAPDVVWKVLTDLDAYSEWNPFITSSVGKAEVGEKLVNRMEPLGGMAITLKTQVTVVEDLKIFEWLGKLGFSRLFDGRHRFDVEATGVSP